MTLFGDTCDVIRDIKYVIISGIIENIQIPSNQWRYNYIITLYLLRLSVEVFRICSNDNSHDRKCDTVAEWLRCWLLSVSELNRPRFEYRSGHYSAI